METENQPIESKKKDWVLPASIIFAAAIISAAVIYATGLKSVPVTPQAEHSGGAAVGAASLSGVLLPAEGVVLPVKWGDLGKRMIEAGVIDKNQFESLYNQRGGLNNEERQLLYGNHDGNLKITEDNAGYLLNLLWAFGLANKNPILEQGPMMDPKYGGAGRFASTGGWTLAVGSAMDHYSRHSLVNLTAEQQALVERVSKNIYRPCCNNATYFPDCNHGMAMLGLLELMAAQGVSEKDMYRFALQVNSYWFPDTYLTIAQYLQKRGIPWDEADPKTLLGYNFSSASGYQKILEQIEPPEKTSGGGCGV
jgi:hypothetical protein